MLMPTSLGCCPSRDWEQSIPPATDSAVPGRQAKAQGPTGLMVIHSTVSCKYVGLSSSMELSRFIGQEMGCQGPWLSCMYSSFPSAQEPGLRGGSVCTRQYWGCTLASSSGTNATLCSPPSLTPGIPGGEHQPQSCVVHSAVRH